MIDDTLKIYNFETFTSKKVPRYINCFMKTYATSNIFLSFYNKFPLHLIPYYA